MCIRDRNLTTVACRISSRLKWYKNYENRLRLAKVIVKNKMSRFLWFIVYLPSDLQVRCTGWRRVDATPSFHQQFNIQWVTISQLNHLNAMRHIPMIVNLCHRRLYLLVITFTTETHLQDSNMAQQMLLVCNTVNANTRNLQFKQWSNISWQLDMPCISKQLHHFLVTR